MVRCLPRSAAVVASYRTVTDVISKHLVIFCPPDPVWPRCRGRLTRVVALKQKLDVLKRVLLSDSQPFQLPRTHPKSSRRCCCAFASGLCLNWKCRTQWRRQCHQKVKKRRHHFWRHLRVKGSGVWSSSSDDFCSASWPLSGKGCLTYIPKQC